MNDRGMLVRAVVCLFFDALMLLVMKRMLIDVLRCVNFCIDNYSLTLVALFRCISPTFSEMSLTFSATSHACFMLAKGCLIGHPAAGSRAYRRRWVAGWPLVPAIVHRLRC